MWRAAAARVQRRVHASRLVVRRMRPATAAACASRALATDATAAGTTGTTAPTPRASGGGRPLFEPTRHAQAAWARGKPFKPRRPREQHSDRQQQQQRDQQQQRGGDRGGGDERPYPPHQRRATRLDAREVSEYRAHQQAAAAAIAAASKPLPPAAPVEEWNARLAQLAHAGGGMDRLLGFTRDLLVLSNHKPNVRTFAIVLDAVTRSGRTDWPLDQALSLLRRHHPDLSSAAPEAEPAASNGEGAAADDDDDGDDGLLDVSSADEALDRNSASGRAAVPSASRVQLRTPLPRTLSGCYALVLRALALKADELPVLWDLYTEMTTTAPAAGAAAAAPRLPAVTGADADPLHVLVMEALSRAAGRTNSSSSSSSSSASGSGSGSGAANVAAAAAATTGTTSTSTGKPKTPQQIADEYQQLLLSRMWHIVNRLTPQPSHAAAGAAPSPSSSSSSPALATAYRLLASACVRRRDTDSLKRVHERANEALGGNFLAAVTSPVGSATPLTALQRLHRLQLAADSSRWADVDAQLADWYTALAAAASKPTTTDGKSAGAADAADAELLPAAARAELGDAYAVAIRSLSRAGEWRTVLQRFDDMQRALFTMRVDTFNDVLSCVGRARQYDALERVFWWVFSRDVRNTRPELAAAAPDLTSFKHMCHAFASARDTANVHKYLRIMRSSRRLSPDVGLYTVVLKAHVDKGEVELIVQRMQMMRADGVVPDTVSYNMLLRACAARDDTRALAHYFGEMKQVHALQVQARKEAEQKLAAAAAAAAAAAGTGEAGAPAAGAAAAAAASTTAVVGGGVTADALPRVTVTPDLYTYGILIHDRLKARYTDPKPLTEQQAARRAEKYGSDKAGANKWTRTLVDDPHALQDVTALFKEMKEQHNLVPDAVCYNSLLTYFARRRDVANMQRYYFLMRSAGVRPTLINYHTLLGGLAAEHDVFAMLEHVNEMRALNIQPSGFVYSVLLSEYARRLDVVSVLRVWDEMHADAAKLHGASADGNAAAAINPAAAAAAGSSSTLPPATKAALRDLTPNRMHWYAIVPHFTVPQLGVSERVALAAKKAMSVADAEQGKTAKHGGGRYAGSRPDTALSPAKLEALYAFMEELRAQKWTM